MTVTGFFTGQMHFLSLICVGALRETENTGTSRSQSTEFILITKSLLNCLQMLFLTDELLTWLCVCSEVQMICISSGWCQCHTVISCIIKTTLVSSFWCWLTQVVLKKRQLNGESLLNY